jgi:hypothetical protein
MRRLPPERKRALDKTEPDCKTADITTTEETMEINRRQLALPALALGLLSVVPAFAASADEDAVAKNVEAFRAAQVAANAEALAALCAAELSYSHSDGRVEDKATFIANATNGKSKFLSLEYQDPGYASSAPPRSCVSTGWANKRPWPTARKAPPISTS